ncbi:type IV pilin N-terminal domain-containing protein [Natrinema thermotolerans]|uniref:Type IV pilin N-terminal domain-containing protein n=1 Tax=Natrinema thermotolerans TaxID=121872 RepID=A0AAF0P907_9EURY|nr:type IV pilin N-terminal domain-containing protein [Natrinema thermotolerans]QCC59164.1 type IV pilin [Natrinema thermotolerans]WMT06119.1 type IV pilin N-terminal domain-containing protein [Natrinema thermotolerans]
MTEETDRIATVDTRAVSPVIGVLALVALTVCLAAVVAVGVGTWSLEDASATATFELSADGDRSAIAITHVTGDAIDVETLSVTIAVNGTAIAEQPPIPFVGASGFDGAPDGPFNAKSDSEWTAGERAGVALASTNSPTLAAGDSVTVTLATDGKRIATLETTAT